jgi:hypothetical protein
MATTWAEPVLRLVSIEERGTRVRLRLRVETENLELVSAYLKERLPAGGFGVEAEDHLWANATEADLMQWNDELRGRIAERDRWKNDPERQYVVTYVMTKDEKRFRSTPVMDRHEMLRFVAAINPELPMGDVLVNGEALGVADLADLLAEAEEFAKYSGRAKKG